MRVSFRLASPSGFNESELASAAANLLNLPPLQLTISLSQPEMFTMQVRMCSSQAALALAELVAQLELSKASNAFGTPVLQISLPTGPNLFPTPPSSPPLPERNSSLVVLLCVALSLLFLLALTPLITRRGRRRCFSYCFLGSPALDSDIRSSRRTRMVDVLTSSERAAALAAARSLPGSLTLPREVRPSHSSSVELGLPSVTDFKLTDEVRDNATPEVNAQLVHMHFFSFSLPMVVGQDCRVPAFQAR